MQTLVCALCFGTGDRLSTTAITIYQGTAMCAACLRTEREKPPRR